MVTMNQWPATRIPMITHVPLLSRMTTLHVLSSHDGIKSYILKMKLNLL